MTKTLYKVATEYKTGSEEGFNIRLEARLKNADLVGARELAGLTAKEAAERIGISYGAYLSFESMKLYPAAKTRKKICDYYRELGVFVLEEDLFPDELRKFTPRKYIGERMVPKIELVSLSGVSEKLLPVAERGIEKELEYNELLGIINDVLFSFPYRPREIIKMRFGLGGEEPRTLREIGKIFHVGPERIRQIEAKALRVLKGRTNSPHIRNPKYWR